MSGAKKSTWVAGTVVVALLMVVAAWFVAISPALATASEIRDQTRQTEQQNVVLQAEVDQLAADFARIDEYKAELALLRAGIPTSLEGSEYLRQLSATAETHGVTVLEVSTQPAQAVVIAEPAAVPGAVSTEAQPAPEPSPSASAAPGAAAPAAPAPAGPVAPAGFTSVPYSIKVLGTYDATLAFLRDLQLTQPRLFLASGIEGTAQPVADAAGGRPATAAGDQELSITGFAWVLPDILAMVAELDEPAAEPGPLPAAVPGRNPLVPVTGS